MHLRITRRAFAAIAIISLTLGFSSPAHADPQVDRVIAQGLDVPWGITFLPDGSALVSERDNGTILRVDPKKAAGRNTTQIGKVTGSQATGEGGLLGLALTEGSATSPPKYLFAYTTTRTDNRVIRIDLKWSGSTVTLGKQTPILTGIPKNSYHNGGRLLLGDNETLYVATGDAGDGDLSQDRSSLAGKVLHITFEGEPAATNPDPTSPVYSVGHRNVQGLAFDDAGNLWASEFGEKDADELNLLRAGENYGWPYVEGQSTDFRFENPKVQWSPTSKASPSGITYADGTIFIASLRGEVLWQVPIDNTQGRPAVGKAIAAKLGDLGRLRTVAQAPDGSLWLMTSNTDGRGQPRSADDRILRLTN